MGISKDVSYYTFFSPSVTNYRLRLHPDFIKKHGYGIQHLGVLVEDMESALAEAKAAGFAMTMDGAGFGLDDDGHYAYLDTEDAIGTTIELIERPKGRMKPEKIYPPEEKK